MGVETKVAQKEERANSSKKEREVMTSQSFEENSKVNSISTLKVSLSSTLMTSLVSSTLMTSLVSSTLTSVTSTVNSVETANQNAQNSTVSSTSTLMMTSSVENLTSIWKTSQKEAKAAKEKA